MRPVSAMRRGRGANKEVVVNFGGGSSLQGEQTPLPMEDDNWDRAVALESDNKDLNRKNAALKSDNANLEKELRETKHQLQQSDDQLSQLRAKLQVLEAQNKKTTEDLTDEKAAHLDANTTIDRLYAENEQAHAARDGAIKERDDALSQQYLLKIELEDVTAQWRDLDEKNNQLIEELDAAQEIADSSAELENDFKKLREEHIDQDREILVKNERIENLEQQIQKANKRLLEMADEKARAAAASPTDDNRHIGSLGDTLEDELSGLDDESYYEPEFNVYSDIFEISTSPIEPARAPPSTIHTQEASSVAPVAAPAPTLNVYVGDAASTQPIQPARAPASSTHVQTVVSYAPVEPARAPASNITEYESISVAPVAARLPTQSVHFSNAANTSPIEPTRTPSTIFEQEIASFAPVEPVHTPSTISEHHVASFAPIEPVRVPSAVTEYQVASFAPVEPTRALSTLTEHEIINFAPIEANRTLYTITEQEVFSFAPTEPPRVPSTITEYAIASTEPVEPARAHSTFTEQEIVSVAPVQPSLPTLSLTIAEAASTGPRLRQITTTDLSTQTVEPQQSPASTRGTQTRPMIPPAPNNRLDSVTVTHAIEPVAQLVVAPSRTTSTGAQTTEETDIIEKPKAPVVTSPTTVKLGKKRSSLVWFFGVLDVILSIYCFYIFSELAYWKNANGYGFGNGYGNVASRSGAFGNGRHLLGLPVGMTVGDSWLSESIARHMSAAISRIEDWAGIAYELHY
ncbi:hypothetical protein CFE70_000575 [Pyrenophora teres f. teres 0-1]|nr:hypothetical protein HRS9139_04257 [Pyrenophora teres f. teres]KAE8837872.1 hypothetical protein PTNB85_05207 [Pyrenophora teres f. teres]KAE8869067.1 hypothetical protein PTNB73_04120 [Pyrenophora teres f. teres]CAE6997909.1 hypothetical protein PTTW11_00619 [Pyrenophora teres f. teres]